MSQHAIRRFGRNQAGEGKLALIIGIVVIVAAVYFLKLVIPPRIHKAELVELIEQRTREYVVNQITMDQLQESVLKEAKDLEIPLKDENLEIDETDTRVRVKASYDLVQKLVGGKEWKSHHDIEVEIPKL